MSKIKVVKYYQCPECETSFRSERVIDGKLPYHTFSGKPCEGNDIIIDKDAKVSLGTRVED